MPDESEEPISSLERTLKDAGWSFCYRESLPARPGEWVPCDDLQLGPAAREYIGTLPKGLYKHQYLALRAFLDGQHVCLTTGTASGKSVPFYAAGLHLLSRQPHAAILALYPTKALGRSQEERWRDALTKGNFPGSVVRIDGDVRPSERNRKLKSCSVLVATPDVVHAWLLSNLTSPEVKKFLSRLQLLIVDETHVYTGIFGTNAAFLFRRLRHASQCLSGGHNLFIMAASATMLAPEDHMGSLFGTQFKIIGPNDDTSPQYPSELTLLKPPTGQELRESVPYFLSNLIRSSSSRFLAFVESRKQTELLTSLLLRKMRGIDANEDDDGVAAAGDPRVGSTVLPYRAGYEDEDRCEIERSLASGHIRGVISTSALELGVDIPGIDTGILVGMPATITSFRQRIGRIGRHDRGHIYLIYGGSTTDDLVFSDPNKLRDLPPSPACIYLGNPRAQYIHALCFGGASGEYEMIRQGSGGRPEAEAGESSPPEDLPPIDSPIDWPEGFLELCQLERDGQTPRDLLPIKLQAMDDPWHSFPLRNLDRTFDIVVGMGGDVEPLGSLSYAQLMREAYPGAVYYHMSRPYRVKKVATSTWRVKAAPERNYTTEPITRPAIVHPQFDGEDVHGALRLGELVLAECDLYVSEAIFGFREHRGPTTQDHDYPNIYWPRQRFTHNYLTTGVVISHPAFDDTSAPIEALADLVLQAFLLAAPFDRNEVAVTTMRHRTNQAWFQAGTRSVVVFDRVYGSLRLSAELVNPATLRKTLEGMTGILDRSPAMGAMRNDPAIRAAIGQLVESAQQSHQELEPPPATVGHRGMVLVGTIGDRATAGGAPTDDSDSRVVIVPGGLGWILTEGNCELRVDRIVYRPREGLGYSGHKASDEVGSPPSWYPVDCVREVPGLAHLGRYMFDTGEVIPLEGNETEEDQGGGLQTESSAAGSEGGGNPPYKGEDENNAEPVQRQLALPQPALLGGGAKSGQQGSPSEPQ